MTGSLSYAERVHESAPVGLLSVGSFTSSIVPVISTVVAIVLFIVGWKVTIWLTNHGITNGDLTVPAELLDGVDLEARRLADLDHAATQAELGALGRFRIPLERAGDRQSGDLQAALRQVSTELTKYIAVPAPAIDDVVAAHISAHSPADIPAGLDVRTLLDRTEEQKAIRALLAAAIEAAENEIRERRRA